MAMKYRWLGAPKYNWLKPFKWEWAVTFNNGFILAVMSSRELARKEKVLLERLRYKEVVLKRRLVQAHWEDYNDSFKYNAKGNGNGR